MRPTHRYSRNLVGDSTARCPVLETAFGEICANQPTYLAHHHLSAGNEEAAVGYFFRSAVQATERCATKEARTLANKGMTILRHFPPSRRRNGLKIDLHSLLAGSHIRGKLGGSSRPETEFRRALELCHKIDSVEKSIPTLWALATSHLLAGRVNEAAEGGHHIVSLAKKLQKPDLISATAAASAISNFTGVISIKPSYLLKHRWRSTTREASPRFRQFYGTDRKGQALRRKRTRALVSRTYRCSSSDRQ